MGVSKTIAASAYSAPANGQNTLNSPPTASAPDTSLEAQYWAALSPGVSAVSAGPQQSTAAPKAASVPAPTLCEVYYFHTDQVGLPEELTNAQGHIVWQASYKTWGNTAQEHWQLRHIHGEPLHGHQAADTPQAQQHQQNLRFQGQYLDRETGLHYNTFRYYDADIGRFISPDPIGLEGGINLGSYSPNPVGWIDPWGLTTCGLTAADKRKMGPAPAGMVNPHRHHIIREMAPKNWSKAERGPIHHAQNLAKKFGIDVNKSLQNFTWAQNGGGAHTKQAATHVRDVLVPAARQGRAAFEKALSELGKQMTDGKFF